MPRSGIEPPTPPLPRVCSTPELPRHTLSGRRTWREHATETLQRQGAVGGILATADWWTAPCQFPYPSSVITGLDPVIHCRSRTQCVSMDASGLAFGKDPGIKSGHDIEERGVAPPNNACSFLPALSPGHVEGGCGREGGLSCSSHRLLFIPSPSWRQAAAGRRSVTSGRADCTTLACSAADLLPGKLCDFSGPCLDVAQIAPQLGAS